MKKQIEYLINSIILKKYPEIISLDDVTDIAEELSFEHLEHRYHVSLTTSECLDDNKMMEIDSEIKTLFKMLGIRASNPFLAKEPNIETFFDCGDGEGYIFKCDMGYRR